MTALAPARTGVEPAHDNTVATAGAQGQDHRPGILGKASLEEDPLARGQGPAFSGQNLGHNTSSQSGHG